MRRPKSEVKSWKLGVLAVSFLGAFGSQALGEVSGLTLSEAYQMALQQSEDVAIKMEILQAAQGRFYKAMDTVMPKVNFLITRKEQDAPESSGSSDGVGSSLTRRTTPERKFVFSQPLFSGFKEFAALEASGAEKSQRSYEWQRAKELLFLDVMGSYYAVLEAHVDVRILEANRKILTDRIEELEARAKIGRSKQSEIQSTITDLKIIESDWENAKGRQAIAVQLLEYYIGSELQNGLSDESKFSEEAGEVAHYLNMLSNRLDVKAAKEASVLAEKNVVVARSGLFPTIKLDGNYYTERVGFQSGIDWDVLFTIDVPIFDGTETIGNIKEAAANRQKAKLEWSKSQRIALLEIKNAFQDFKTARREEIALSEAVLAAKKNYEMQLEDFEKNLVSHLDVLEALKKLKETELRHNKAHYEVIKSFWSLKVSVGEIR